MPRATLMHLLCSPNFPRASYLDECTLMYEPIVNWSFKLQCMISKKKYEDPHKKGEKINLKIYFLLLKSTSLKIERSNSSFCQILQHSNPYLPERIWSLECNRGKDLEAGVFCLQRNFLKSLIPFSLVSFWNALYC